MLICDIDNCIVDHFHRSHLIPKSNKSDPHSWIEFNKACVNDLPNIPVIEMVKHLAKSKNKKITFVTARGDSARKETIEQLSKYFYDYIWDLHMRKMDDSRSCANYKKEVFEKLNDLRDERLVIIDDDSTVIKMVADNFPYADRLLIACLPKKRLSKNKRSKRSYGQSKRNSGTFIYNG